MSFNPSMTPIENNLWDKITPLRGKHLFTKHYGDGEIETITRKNDLSGLFVYFHSNLEGSIKLDGQEFLNEVEEVKELKG